MDGHEWKQRGDQGATEFFGSDPDWGASSWNGKRGPILDI